MLKTTPIIADYGFEMIDEEQNASPLKMFYIACDFPPEAKGADSAAAALQAEIAPLLCQQFFRHKDIAILMITLIGKVTAADFHQAWQQQLAQNILLKTGVQTSLRAAVVTHGDEEGNVLSEADLLATV